MPSSDMLLERELKEARQREADYRGRLARHRELALKLRSHATALREALRGLAAGSNSMARLLANVARLSGRALGIPRASIWLFDETRKNLLCRFRVCATGDDGGDGERLATDTCPRYLAALSTTEIGAVAVNDARQDFRTSELQDYLQRHDIGALLDIPIVGPGGILHGVVCHEHQGGPRVWQEEEIDFATDVGVIVALALEAERRATAETAARGSEAKYQDLVESLPVTVYSFHARTGQLDYLSPRIVELGGRSAEQHLVAGGIARWLELIEPEDREPVQKRLSGNIEEGLSEELIYRIRLPDGTRRWIRDTCRVVRDARGKPFAVQGTLADITALKQAELARFEAERTFRSLLENADLLAIILSATGHVQFVNDCFSRLTGYTREEALGADGFDLIIPESDRKGLRDDFLKSIAQNRLAPRFESTIRTRTGDRRRILWTNTLMRTASGEVTGTASLGMDVTERLEAEASQLERQKLESLGRLAATVAHDFNNLLTIVAVAASSTGEPVTPRGQIAREEIDFAIDQATALTKSLLSYARHEPIAPVLLSVDEVVASTLPMLGTLTGPQIEFRRDLDAPSASVVIDPTQLRQVLINLVTNAADATRGYGTMIRVSTNLVVLEADQARAKGLIAEGMFLVLTVADNGRGMSAELVERAFDPFFTTKEKGKGTGLGLAMCESIVRRAGGFISVDSVPAEGSTFRVHLPVAEAYGASDRIPVTSPLIRAMAKPRAMVVDDNEAIRNLVTQVLSHPWPAGGRGGESQRRTQPGATERRRRSATDRRPAARWQRPGTGQGDGRQQTGAADRR